MEWEELRDDAGNAYFYNNSTGESSWEAPLVEEEWSASDAGAAVTIVDVEESHHEVGTDWEELRDDAGNAYFYNNVTGESSWEPPTWGDLKSKLKMQRLTSALTSAAEDVANKPVAAEHAGSEWEELDDGAGNAYFYNHITGETSWEPPTWGDLKSKLKMQRLTSALTSAATEEIAVDDAAPATIVASGPAGAARGGAEWSEQYDEFGNVYYFNASTGETSWEAPTWSDLKSKLKMKRMTSALTSAADAPEVAGESSYFSNIIYD